MQKLRLNILILITLLIAFGIIFLYSSSGVYAALIFNDRFYFIKRQLLFLLIGIIFSFILLRLKITKLRGKSRIFLVFSYLLLISVLIFGVRVRGAKRWFGILGFGIQPIEFVKIIYIFYLADFLERKKFYDRNFLHICLPVYLTLGAFIVLLLLQPDFGNAMLLIFLTVSLLYFAGIPFKFLSSTLIGMSPFISFAFWKFEYLRLRLLGFLYPWQRSKDIGFQLIQSYIAIGSGRVFGQGLGLSKQKLFYLPQAHNDFIFSIIAEEIGFIGGCILIFLYLFLILNFLKILNRIYGTFEKLLLMGLVLSFVYQVVINLAVCLGLLPTKGLPLPLISYGGSSLIANLIIISLILNLSKKADLS